MRGFPNLRIVLPEHFKFACAGFNCYFQKKHWNFWHLNLSFRKGYWDVNLTRLTEDDGWCKSKIIFLHDLLQKMKQTEVLFYLYERVLLPSVTKEVEASSQGSHSANSFHYPERGVLPHFLFQACQWLNLTLGWWWLTSKIIDSKS